MPSSLHASSTEAASTLTVQLHTQPSMLAGAVRAVHRRSRHGQLRLRQAGAKQRHQDAPHQFRAARVCACACIVSLPTCCWLQVHLTLLTVEKNAAPLYRCLPIPSPTLFLLQLRWQRAHRHSAAVMPLLQGPAREIRPQPGTTRAVERARRLDRFAPVCVSTAARLRHRLALTRARRSALLQRACSPLLLGRRLVCSSCRQRGVTGTSEHPARLSHFARACRTTGPSGCRSRAVEEGKGWMREMITCHNCLL